jgi:hypothetical protein
MATSHTVTKLPEKCVTKGLSTPGPARKNDAAVALWKKEKNGPKEPSQPAEH